MSGIFGGGFSAETTGWKSDPSHRGTYSILSTCFVTLGLCIWTAIHLNIPEHHASWTRQVCRKIGWMMLGFIAPELVVFTAFQQYRAARGLHDKMRYHFPVDPKERARKSPPNPCWLRWPREHGSNTNRETYIEETPESLALKIHARKTKWTMTHSYFGVMGGFALQVADGEANFFPSVVDGKDRHVRLSLTPDALVYLEEQLPGIVPDLPKTFIEDKSKGSIFAKSIVCFQAIWFCIQCLSRVGQGLAISLLELNTFGHAICTVLIYFLWWNKPLDIEEPEVIMIKHGDDKLAMIVAHMCAVSSVDPLQPCREDRTRFHVILDTVTGIKLINRETVQQAFDRAWASLCKDRRSSAELYLTIQLAPTFTLDTLKSDPMFTSDLHIPLTKSYNGVLTTPVLTTTITPSIDFPDPGQPVPLRPSISIPHLDLRRWLLFLISTHHGYKPRSVPRDSVAARLRNTPWFTAQNYIPLYTSLSLSGFIYGGLHILAWGASFPTHAEKILWRLSSVTVASTGAVVAIVLFWDRSKPFWKGDPLGGFWMAATVLMFGAGVLEMWFTRGERREDQGEGEMEVERGGRKARGWRSIGSLVWTAVKGVLAVPACVAGYGPGVVVFLLKFAFDLVVPVMVGLYVLARVYLVVESFINLSHLPESAYEMPVWSLYVPHIG
ncbi:hypothetical protein QBC47DRAFT_164925 [Echria macrotheca]|uniref:Uncharacterized protein n=1 Tax=Echria macrotheca TaxID=438768 RepID=A0AAJ0BGW7_9PEZI|nr:hypothetical protein QBC47DRAFT_164925 [Echria macrotheca]